MKQFRKTENTINVSKVLSFYQSGKTFKHLAEQMGASLYVLRKQVCPHITKAIKRAHWENASRCSGMEARKQVLLAFKESKGRKSDRELAEMFGVSRQTICNLRKRFSLPPSKATHQRKKARDKVVRKITALYASGKTTEEIGGMIGKSESQTRHLLGRVAGLKIKDEHFNNKRTARWKKQRAEWLEKLKNYSSDLEAANDLGMTQPGICIIRKKLGIPPLSPFARNVSQRWKTAAPSP